MANETPQGTQPLTERRAKFLALAAEGHTHAEIAEMHGVSSRTVSSVIYFARNREIGTVADRLLTARQLEILALVGCGLTDPEIGAKLFLSRRTVENHIRDARERMGASNRLHCLMLVVAQELLILDYDGKLLVPHAHSIAA